MPACRVTDAPVALITGTSQGIGHGLAGRFIEGGYLVVGCSRGRGPDLGERYEHHSLDVGDEEAVRDLLGNIGLRYRRLDVVVNNAGMISAALAVATTPGSAAELMRVNALGAFFVCREAAKLMIPRRSGRIINISSMAVPLQMAGTSLYSSSKAAVIQMSKVLAVELGAFNITCNVVAPSYLATELSSTIRRDALRQALSRLAIKRPCTLADIANAVWFFAQPESGYVTGQVLYLGLPS